MSCDFNRDTTLTKIYIDLNKPAPKADARFSISNGRDKKIITGTRRTIRYICSQFNLTVPIEADCCCSFNGNTLQIDIPIARVGIVTRVLRRRVDFMDIDSATFIASPDSISDDNFVYLEVVELSEEKAIAYAENWLNWLTLQEDISNSISEIPEQEKESLKAFWSTLISEQKLVEQLFNPLQTRQFSSEEATTSLPDSTERIFEAIKAEVEKIKAQEEENLMTMINGLNDTAKNWLGKLLLHLVHNPTLAAKLQTEIQGYLSPYLLFGQTPECIIPCSWIEASWNYIQRFRCNFGFSITQAMRHSKIMIVGTPEIAVPVTTKDEKFLRDYLNAQPDSPKLERLWVRSADELKALLDERVARNISFEGGNVGFYTPQ